MKLAHAIMLPLGAMPTCSTALACPNPTASVQIAASKLADSIDYACKCNKGSLLFHTPPLFAVPFLKGAAANYLDNHFVQSQLHNLKEIEKTARCQVWETVPTTLEK